MAHALWKGAISFGLVNIPINLHSAVRDNRPHFRMLHAKDKSPVRFQRVCLQDEHAVAWKELVRGYEYETGRFVVVTKEDFQAAALEKSRTVDILNFVEATEIDDRFFETPYYLTPAKGGERAYALLREAIHESGKIGIAKIILRESQHLAALAAVDHMLVLTMMRFADELADISAFTIPEAQSVRPQELDMAKALVESLAASWKPDQYRDAYRANLMRIIDAKVTGKKPKLESEATGPKQGDVVDLMARLRQSLESGRKPTREKRPGQRKKAKTSGKTARRVA